MIPILKPLPPPSPSHPSGSSQCTLSHASSLDWPSVSHLIIYMFQCYSLRSSHPRLLPQSPKVCSVHLCLFFCFAYRVSITLFLNSINSSFLKTLMLEKVEGRGRRGDTTYSCLKTLCVSIWRCDEKLYSNGWKRAR